MNFGQISYLVIVLFFLTLNMKMSTWLNFNLFGNVPRRKKTQINYDRALCDNIISGSHFALIMQLQFNWWRNRKAASVCFCLQFPWENWKPGRGEKLQGLKHFTCWYLISFLGAWENNLLLSLLRKPFFFDISICILAFPQSDIWIHSLILETLE